MRPVCVPVDQLIVAPNPKASPDCRKAIDGMTALDGRLVIIVIDLVHGEPVALREGDIDAIARHGGFMTGMQKTCLRHSAASSTYRVWQICDP
jgi:hypothetical protein